MTAEELLMSEESETFEYSNVITIDRESRAINVPLGQEMFGVEGDKNVSIKHFSCPKIVGDNIDIDLSEHNLYVNYVVADKEGNQKSEDVQQDVCKNIVVNGDNITFDWEISEYVTWEDGFVAFSIVAKKSVDGILQPRWYTTPAVGRVLKTIKEGANLAQKYPDVIDNLMNRVAELERIIESGGDGTGGAVSSVNGKTGAVELTAEDVGALPEDTPIPTKTSDLQNDSGFITKAVTDLANYYKKSETYTQDEVKALISAIPKFSIQPVPSLPTTDISTTTVYLLKSGEETDNLYTEYIYVNGAWEYLGKQTVDLTGYVKRTELSNYYTIEAIDELVNTLYGQIPTKVSQLENDSKFVTSDVTDKLSEEITDQFGYTKYGLPVLKLTGDTTGMSKDVKKTLAYEYGELTGSCTLKWQGSSSLSHEKKNYTIEFDNPFEAKDGWGSQKKYCLKANFIDHTHARNIVCAKLWGKLVKSRTTVDERLNTLVNGGAIDGFPIVIELNGVFHGLYTFNIPKEPWLFGMTDTTVQQAILCAESPSNLETAASFNALAVLDGTDFDLEYSSDGESEWVVTSINRLIQAVMDSNGSDLDTTLAKYIDWDSAIDHYIFTTLIQGEDNIIKNYLLVTYDGVKWFFSEYDMDTVFGLYWTGKRFYANEECHQFRTRTFDKLMNLIWTYKRPQLRARYKELRANIMAEDKVAREFLNFSVGIPRTILDMDVNAHPTIPSSAVNNVSQILNNYRMRVLLTDEWIEYTTGELEPPVAIENVLATSTDASGAVYNGKGYKENTRISTSSNYEERELADVYLTGYMECKIGDVFYFENITFTEDAYSNLCYMFDSSMTGLIGSAVNTAWFNPVTDTEGNVTAITIPTSEAYPDIGYIRINAKLIDDTSVITKNQPIS